MPAHGVAADRLPRRIERKVFKQQRRQLVSDVIPHLIVRGPGALGGIDIKPRALAQIIGLIIGHIFPARRSVGKNQCDALLGRPGLRPGFDHGIFMGAGQPRQIPEQRDRAFAGLLR